MPEIVCRDLRSEDPGNCNVKDFNNKPIVKRKRTGYRLDTAVIYIS